MVRSLLLAVLGGMLLFAAPAVAEEEEPGADTTPPIITNGVLSPSSLSYEGGNSQISLDIIDETELNSVSAQVFGPDGTYQAIALYQGNGSTFYGTLEAPANYSEGTVSYTVEVQAYDAFHNYNAGTIGDVQVEGRPQFDESPWISMTEMWPQALPSEGGPVTISAEAGDNRGLSAVYATVTPTNGGATTEVGLNGISSNRFEGTYQAPPNAGPLAAEYIVEVVVVDDIGQQGRAYAGTIAVEAPPVVEPEPPTSSCKGKPHRPSSLPQGSKGCGVGGKKNR